MPGDDHAFSNHCEKRKTIKARRARQGAEEEKASGARVRQEAQRRLGGSRRESETSAEAEQAYRDHAGEGAAGASAKPAQERQRKLTDLRDYAEEKAASARARPAQERQSKPIETLPEWRQ